MYFHVRTPRINLGQIIQPGAWGQLLRTFTNNSIPPPQNTQVVLWEVALESARRSIEPNQVSRLACTFVWENLADATAFRQQYRPAGVIHEVAPVGQEAASYRGDFSLLSHDVAGGAFVDFMPQVADAYWRSPNPLMPERLYPGALTVIGHYP